MPPEVRLTASPSWSNHIFKSIHRGETHSEDDYSWEWWRMLPARDRDQKQSKSKQLSNINKAPKPSVQERWTKSFSKNITLFKMIMSLTFFFAEGKQYMEDQLFPFLIGTCQGNSYKPRKRHFSGKKPLLREVILWLGNLEIQGFSNLVFLRKTCLYTRHENLAGSHISKDCILLKMLEHTRPQIAFSSQTLSQNCINTILRQKPAFSAEGREEGIK